MNAVTHDPIRLSELNPQVCAIVRRLEIDDEDMSRLKTLGICIGRQVEVARKGDPTILRVFGSRLGVARALTERVWVEVCTPGHCVLREPSCV